MSAPHEQNSHPRRRPVKAHASPLSTHGMNLRKSPTFHAHESISTDICGLDNQQFMPRRSTTSPESLEALLTESPSVRRVADLLKAFDDRLAGYKTDANIPADPEVLPVPSFVLDSATFDGTPMEIDSKPSAVARNPHQHASDSGLGTSIGASKYDAVRTQRSSVRHSLNTSISSTHAAVTRGYPTLGASPAKHVLSDDAADVIRDSIIKPILAEESLKDFHPLVKDVPRRIGEHSICNLRDLEKTLIFLAPVSGIRYLSDSAKVNCIRLGFKELSATATSYLRFCERSIHLLHATVDHIHGEDLRLPSDRPYTNNYFLDLVQQIRRYAAIMAATRAKEAKGEELNDMDYSRDEKITLRGGLSYNGRPVELVREKDGKVMSISESTQDAFKVSKRSLTDDEMDEDEITRSMARRRKSDKPGDVMHMCRDCQKEFKRPCDLTKHEKTHSRPWKCSEQKCKYFDLGWPTEKERDRHMNDKHSAAPAQYKCHYAPCTYASKRESNCKQHMEKAHGWEYVRSKSNGRKKASGDERSPSTPLTPFLGTPMSANLTTPITPFAPSPLQNDYELYGYGTPALSAQGFQDEFRRDSVTTNGTHFTYSSGPSPIQPTLFDDAVTPEDTTINHNDVFNNCTLGANYSEGFQQQPTPALSTTFDFEPFQFGSGSMAMGSMANGITQLSPLAQPDVTLFSPEMHMDEGFGDMDLSMNSFTRPTEDFTLFDSMQPPNMMMSSTANFFPDYNLVGGQFDQSYTSPSDPTMMMDDMLGSHFGAQ